MGKEGAPPPVSIEAHKEERLFQSFTPDVQRYIRVDRSIRNLQETEAVTPGSKAIVMERFQVEIEGLRDKFQQEFSTGSMTSANQLSEWGKLQQQKVQRKGVKQ